MIRVLRERHFRMAILLAILVPALLLVALAARHRFPVGPLPPPIAGPVAP
ncbi:MAG TPA: hypothetical protein VFU23_02375 [Gemmatimonadales bacterium]|nr:hypothetical protein [Gemmatimonadales bacterium]